VYKRGIDDNPSCDAPVEAGIPDITTEYCYAEGVGPVGRKLPSIACEGVKSCFCDYLIGITNRKA
jgi:hypothetical protein